METLRVLLVTTFYPPYHLGGDAVHVQYLAEALASRGHEVHVEFSPAAYRLKRRKPAGPDRGFDGVTVHPIPAPLGRASPIAAYSLGSSRGVTRFHERLVDGVRPDVIHCHNVSLLGLGVLRRRRGARLLYTAHDYWVRCPRSDLVKYGKDLCEQPACVSCSLISRRPPQMWRYGTSWKGLPAIDLAIAPSRFMAAAIAPFLECPVAHVPNFAPDTNPDGTLSEPEDYFLFVGTLEPHKGVHELTEAALRLPSSQIKVVGMGSRLPTLKKAAMRSRGKLEVEGWVSQDRLHRLYRHARALVIPSTWHENAPLAALEALSWGAPLLVSRRGGLEELLYGGRTGRGFEPEPENLLRALKEFQREALHDSLRAGARSAYERFHGRDSYLSRYVDLIRGEVDDLSRETLARRSVLADPSSLSSEPIPGG